MQTWLNVLLSDEINWKTDILILTDIKIIFLFQCGL